MQLSTKEAVKLIHKLGVEVVECKHHIRGFLTVDGRRLFPVHCSFGNKELPGNVPHLIRKSLKLSISEFEVLRSCKLHREAYLALLQAKGALNQ